MDKFVYELASLIIEIRRLKERDHIAVIYGGKDPTAEVVRRFCAGFGLEFAEPETTDFEVPENAAWFFSWRASVSDKRIQRIRDEKLADGDAVTFFFPMTMWNPAWFMLTFPDVLEFDDWSICVRKDKFLPCLQSVSTVQEAKRFIPIRKFLEQRNWFIYRRFPYVFSETFYESLTAERSKLYGTIIRDFPSISKNLASINQVCSALSDATSRTQYRRLFSGNHRLHWENYFDNFLHGPQYFDCIEFEHVRNILNLGIHTGEEIPLFMNLIGEEGNIVNVDPGGDSCLPEETSEYLDGHSDRVSFYCDFAGNGEEIAFNKRDDGYFCVVDREKNDFDGVVRTKTITEILADSAVGRVDLIKVDIEGAEEKIIDQIVAYTVAHRCQIALSIYHTEDHNWSLPAKLVSELDDYLFYYRCYSWQRYEGVFYCVPAEYRNRNPIAVNLID